MRTVVVGADLETLELDMERLLADPLTPVFVVERTDGKLAAFVETGTRKYADGALSSPVSRRLVRG